MDANTIGVVLLAVVTGLSEALGDQLWTSVVSLIRRPLRHNVSPTAGKAVVPSGEAELAALQQTPQDQQKAVALAEVLLARADADDDFKHALISWWEQAAPVRASIGNVRNTISGGTQYGPVLQGRDFSNLTFSASPAPPLTEHKDPGAE